jgi:hypothetical protein
VVVDLAGAETLSAQTVECLLDADSRVGVRLRVVAPRRGRAYDALRSAGVTHTLAVYGSRPAALAAAD